MKELVVVILGASGIVYGIQLLELMRAVANVETHLIMSTADVGLQDRWWRLDSLEIELPNDLFTRWPGGKESRGT